MRPSGAPQTRLTSAPNADCRQPPPYCPQRCGWPQAIPSSSALPPAPAQRAASVLTRTFRLCNRSNDSCRRREMNDGTAPARRVPTASDSYMPRCARSFRPRRSAALQSRIAPACIVLSKYRMYLNGHRRHLWLCNLSIRVSRMLSIDWCLHGLAGGHGGDAGHELSLIHISAAPDRPSCHRACRTRRTASAACSPAPCSLPIAASAC